MSTETPTYSFSLKTTDSYTDLLYNGAIYDLLEQAISDEKKYQTRCFNFRGEMHIYGLIEICKKFNLYGLEFIANEFSVVNDEQLDDAHHALAYILDFIETALTNNDLQKLTYFTDYCYSSSDELVIDDIREAYKNTGSLNDVSPYNTGHDEGPNVLHAFFDYIKSLHELVTHCRKWKRVLVNFHHPA